MHTLDKVTFDWWINGRYHRAYNTTRRFHGKMVAFSERNRNSIDLIVGPIEEQHTVKFRVVD